MAKEYELNLLLHFLFRFVPVPCLFCAWEQTGFKVWAENNSFLKWNRLAHMLFFSVIFQLNAKQTGFSNERHMFGPAVHWRSGELFFSNNLLAKTFHLSTVLSFSKKCVYKLVISYWMITIFMYQAILVVVQGTSKISWYYHGTHPINHGITMSKNMVFLVTCYYFFLVLKIPVKNIPWIKSDRRKQWMTSLSAPIMLSHSCRV